MSPAASSEKTSLVPPAEVSPWFSVVRTVICGCAYILASASLINFNKSLMVEGGVFPFSVPLVMVHTAVSSLCTAMLFILAPSLFPSLTGPMKLAVDYDLIVGGALPVAFPFSIALVLSNTAYVHSDVAFLQMMKEGNVVLVYFFSVLVSLEVFRWRYFGVLGFIVVSTFVSVHGALDFSMAGFLLQGGSQLADCLKITMQALILSNAGKKLDVLSYVLLVMPLCFFFLASSLCILAYMDVEGSAFSMPTWSQFKHAAPVLVPNAMLAFILNVLVALFMKWSSGVAFVLTGILKDVCIVSFGVLFMAEQIRPIQVMSFSLQVLGIFIWAMMKLYPAEFDAGVIRGLAFVFCGRNRAHIPAASAKLAEPDTESPASKA